MQKEKNDKHVHYNFVPLAGDCVENEINNHAYSRKCMKKKSN